MVGLLALQGNSKGHEEKLSALGVSSKEIRKITDCSGISALIVPGGESTAMLTLLEDSLRTKLKELISNGLPVLATCAGAILLATRVSNPEQPALELLDIDVERNAYGRQRNSFITQALDCTTSGAAAFGKLFPDGASVSQQIEGIFIRAPRITRVGSAVQVLLECNNDPVLVQQKNILAATFHPELSETTDAIHRLFLQRLAYSKNE